MFGGLLRVLGMAVGAGGVVGVALGLTVLAADPSSGGSVSAATVTVYACPGAGEVGTLHGGDRVLITGRTGDWLAVRNLRGGLERVFVSALAVTPDADLSVLPDDVSCDLLGSVALNETTTTTTPSTTIPGDSTTSSVPIVTTTTTTVPVTVAPPPQAPSVGSPSANPNAIWEKYPAIPSTCPGNGITTIAAAVSAAAGTQSVTLSWSSSIGGGTKPMTSGGGAYTATLGPFDAGAGGGVPYTESITVVATVTVIDALGRSASNQTNVTLHDCTFE